MRLPLLPLFSVCAVVATAQPGTLDPSFNGTGFIEFWPTGFEDSRINRVIALDDTTMLWCGRTHVDAPDREQAIIGKFLNDGSYDTSFGTNGFTLLDDTIFSEATDMTLDGQGRILVTGSRTSTYYQLFIARLLPDGSFDASFGNGGIVYHASTAGTGFFANSICFNDPFILVGGRYSPTGNSNWDAAVMRFAADGSLDPGFGNGGVATVNFGVGLDAFEDIDVLGNGSIIGVGNLDNGFRQATLALFDPTGQLDTDFGTGGIVTDPVNTSPDCTAMGVIADGMKFVVVGSKADAILNDDGYIARFDSTGQRDATTFAFPFGVLYVDLGGADDYMHELTRDGDGHYVMCGTGGNSNVTNMLVVRCDTAGMLDPVFGLGGIAEVDCIPLNTSFGDEVAYTVDVQVDGKVLAFGKRPTTNTNSMNRMLGLRLHGTNLGTGVAAIHHRGFEVVPTYCTGGSVRIQAEPSLVGSVVKVHDRSGRTLLQRNVTDGSTLLDLSFLAPGCYLVEVVGTIGQRAVPIMLVEQ